MQGARGLGPPGSGPSSFLVAPVGRVGGGELTPQGQWEPCAWRCPHRDFAHLDPCPGTFPLPSGAAAYAGDEGAGTGPRPHLHPQASGAGSPRHLWGEGTSVGGEDAGQRPGCISHSDELEQASVSVRFLPPNLTNKAGLKCSGPWLRGGFLRARSIPSRLSTSPRCLWSLSPQQPRLVTSGPSPALVTCGPDPRRSRRVVGRSPREPASGSSPTFQQAWRCVHLERCGWGAVISGCWGGLQTAHLCTPSLGQRPLLPAVGSAAWGRSLPHLSSQPQRRPPPQPRSAQLGSLRGLRLPPAGNIKERQAFQLAGMGISKFRLRNWASCGPRAKVGGGRGQGSGRVHMCSSRLPQGQDGGVWDRGEAEGGSPGGDPGHTKASWKKGGPDTQGSLPPSTSSASVPKCSPSNGSGHREVAHQQSPWV